MSEFEEFMLVAGVGDVPPGNLVQVEMDGESLVVGNDEGDLFAVSAWCSHEGSALALGSLRDHVLTCFAHQWTYNVKSGDPIWPPIARVAPGYRLRTYRVRVAGGSIWVSKRPARLGLG